MKTPKPWAPGSPQASHPTIPWSVAPKPKHKDQHSALEMTEAARQLIKVHGTKLGHVGRGHIHALLPASPLMHHPKQSLTSTHPCYCHT